MTIAPEGAAVADGDWLRCPQCGVVLYRPRLERDMRVCTACAAHHRLTAAERLVQLLDEGSIELAEHSVSSVDILEFVDTVPYPDRLAKARRTTGLAEGVLVATGTIQGCPVVATAMDFRFLGGSLGGAVGELITRAAELSLARRVPLLLVCASGGARMQEGAIALMQMAKTSQALAELDEAGILTVSLITDPTFGGVAASFATLADVIVAEPGARLGFAGRRVIEQTIGQQLPAEFQTAEFLLGKGLIDLIRPRDQLRGTLARLLATAKKAQAEPAGADPVIRDHRELPAVEAWQSVRDARVLGRPTTVDYIAAVCTDFEELHGDRIGGDCAAVVGGPARIGGRPVMVIGHQKGGSLAELTARNYGMPSPQGYRKAARLLRMAAKLGLPVVTFVDTPGAYPGMEAEENGQAVAIAENIRLLSGLPVPVVTVITGEGGSGGALALAVANEVLICSKSVYSVISPEGCAAILWNDPARTRDAARALRLDAAQLLRLGIVDGVLPEPDGGTQADPVLAAERMRMALTAALDRYSGMDARTLVAKRRARFRAFGSYPTTPDDQEAATS